jgi:pimeloyl-ACP methyl ester carboxylesterase
MAERSGGAGETIEVNGLRVAYERVGKGPPLVLLHGYVGDGPSTWRSQLDALSDEFTVVAWDAPGAGRSADPPESFGMAGYADCLTAFVERLGFAAPHVVGLSFGGALALALCHRHPSLPATLTLASAYAGWAGSLPAEAAEQRLEQALVLADLSAEELVATLLPTMFSAATPQSSVEAFGAALRAFHPIGFRAMARASAEDLRDALPHIAVPTLLIYGDNDVRVIYGDNDVRVIYGDNDVRAPLSVAEHLEAAIADAALIVLPDVGHVCNIEAPEAFNSAVRSFLRDQG